MFDPKCQLSLQWNTYFLCDSDSSDEYFYLITVHTGLRKGAGTKSLVNFVLTGEDEDSGVRILSDGIREVSVYTEDKICGGNFSIQRLMSHRIRI